MTVLLVTVAALCATALPAAAQSVSLYADAPAEPVAPDVITRDGEGRATLRAVRVAQPLRIDGALDEALYRDERPISDFIQVEPDSGQAATERTETWIAFDDDFVYVSFKAWDSRMDAAFQFDLFNATNINSALAVTTRSGASFGRTTSIVAPRVARLGVTYTF